MKHSLRVITAAVAAIAVFASSPGGAFALPVGDIRAEAEVAPRATTKRFAPEFSKSALLTNGQVNAVVYDDNGTPDDLSDDGWLLGGTFTAVTTPKNGSVEVPRLARFHLDGTPDQNFPMYGNADVGPNGSVDKIIFDHITGGWIVGGNFSRVGNLQVAKLMALKKDFNIDDGQTRAFIGLESASSSPVEALAMDDDGNLYAGGDLRRWEPRGKQAVNIGHIVKFRYDEHAQERTFDYEFAQKSAPDGRGLNGPVGSILVVGDNVYVGGGFSMWGSVRGRALAKFDRNGVFDESFAGKTDSVFVLTTTQVMDIQEYQGGLLVGGNFRLVQTSVRQSGYLAKFDFEGNLERDFSESVGRVNGTVRSIAVDPYHPEAFAVVGQFTTFRTLVESRDLPAVRVAKFNAHGFSPEATAGLSNGSAGLNNTAFSVAFGNIRSARDAVPAMVVGGSFTMWDAEDVGRLAGFIDEPLSFTHSSWSLLTSDTSPVGNGVDTHKIQFVLRNASGEEVDGVTEAEAIEFLELQFAVAAGGRPAFKDTVPLGWEEIGEGGDHVYIWHVASRAGNEYTVSSLLGDPLYLNFEQQKASAVYSSWELFTDGEAKEANGTDAHVIVVEAMDEGNRGIRDLEFNIHAQDPANRIDPRVQIHWSAVGGDNTDAWDMREPRGRSGVYVIEIVSSVAETFTFTSDVLGAPLTLTFTE